MSSLFLPYTPGNPDLERGKRTAYSALSLQPGGGGDCRGAGSPAAWDDSSTPLAYNPEYALLAPARACALRAHVQLISKCPRAPSAFPGSVPGNAFAQRSLGSP
ncbi:hypothetical protein P7K49_024477 [Saguinus oedipus]|uniref:Uncharacterized protein n=1 Tax=Saguinus oedipus TaxID=9490 RepID=A0ABQ9UPP1_SAGOE|nr:hypothetical protein P7K49_024477 [Saguinus oedipus]